MKNDLSCDTTKDLLLMYSYRIASKETNICVENHLRKCELCQKEYKDLIKAIENNQHQEVIKDSDYIKTLRKKLIISFLTIIAIGAALIGIAMFNAVHNHPNTKGFLAFIPLYIGVYFLPLLAILVTVIWKKNILKKEDTLWPNVIISFLGTIVLIEVVLLFGKLSHTLSIIDK